VGHDELPRPEVSRIAVLVPVFAGAHPARSPLNRFGAGACKLLRSFSCRRPKPSDAGRVFVTCQPWNLLRLGGAFLSCGVAALDSQASPDLIGPAPRRWRTAHRAAEGHHGGRIHQRSEGPAARPSDWPSSLPEGAQLPARQRHDQWRLFTRLSIVAIRGLTTDPRFIAGAEAGEWDAADP
jgi:hypothetical protein